MGITNRRRPMVGWLCAVFLVLAFHRLTEAERAGPTDDGSCTVLGIYSFTSVDKSGISEKVLGQKAYSHLASQQLAMDHFNKRNSTVVPELLDLIPSNCTVQFTPDEALFFDKQNEERSTFRGIVQSYYTTEHNWCGIMADETRPDIVTLVESFELPFLLYGGGDDFARPQNQVSQLHLLNDYLANHMIDFLSKVLGVRYLGILNDGNRNEDSLTRALTEAAKTMGVHTFPVNLQDASGSTAYRNGLERIQENGYRSIVVFLQTENNLKDFMDAAVDLGMDGPEYFYIMPQISLDLFDYDLTTSQLAFLDGTAFVSVLDNFVVAGDRDPFLQAWRSADSKFKQRLDSASPIRVGDASYFQNTLPSRGSPIIYDTVMALGMAACQLQASGAASRSTLSTIIPDLEFQGASGRMVLDKRGARQPVGMPAGVYNGRMVNGQFRLALVSTTNGDGRWSYVDENTTFLFKDGTTDLSFSDLVVRDLNYLSGWVRLVGFFLYVVATMTSILFLLAIVIMRKDPTILRTQPPYSMMLCVSCFVTAQTILVLSFDEELIDNESFLDRNCLAAPWLLFVGLVATYTVLFCKLWRLDRVMQFRRATKINAIQTMWPLAVMLFVTIALLTAWTVFDPWHWERNFVSTTPPATYGECQSDNFLAWATPLSAVMVVSVLLAFGQAWKTKDIPRDLSDTATVFYAIGVQMQAWFVFIPIAFVLSRSSADATYLGRILWIWILSASPLILVLGPRVVYAIRVRRNPDLKKRRSIRITGVRTSGDNTGFRSRARSSVGSESQHRFASSRDLDPTEESCPIHPTTDATNGAGSNHKSDGSNHDEAGEEATSK